MRILIDTHYLVWAAVTPWELEPWAKAHLEQGQNEVLVSAVSLFEIGIKVRKGQIPEARSFERGLPRNVAALGFELIPVSPEVMLRAARFQSEHRDPFDRMIAAQAIESDVELLSVDPLMRSFGVRLLRDPAA